MKFSLTFFTLIISLSSAKATQYTTFQIKHTRFDSIMDPHEIPRKGPWFEGWYTRLTDIKGQRSIAVIGASQLKNKDLKKETLPGYLAVLISEGNEKPTQVLEVFPEKTKMQSHGQINFESTNFKDDTDFKWSAGNFGYITQNEIHIIIPNTISVDMNMGPALPWDENWNNWGPEGYGSFIELLPLHWFVYSLGSLTNYKITFPNGEKIESKGFAHQEKNWGETFPQAWIWIQGIDKNNSAQIALAGGRVDFGIGDMTTWLVGYRSPSVKANFQPGQPDVIYQSRIDACKGEFELQASNADHVMNLKAKAPLNTFAPVSIPTITGFLKNGGMESFSAEVQVDIKNNNFLSKIIVDNFVEKRVFKNAALEFGADYLKCK